MPFLPKNLLISEIEEFIKENHNRAITGQILQGILIDIVDSDIYPTNYVNASAPDNGIGRDGDYWWRAGVGVYLKISGIYTLILSLSPQPQKEGITFTSVFNYTLNWDATKISKYGAYGSFQIYILDDASGKFLLTAVSISTNSQTAPSQYIFDFGGPATGFIVIN